MQETKDLAIPFTQEELRQKRNYLRAINYLSKCGHTEERIGRRFRVSGETVRSDLERYDATVTEEIGNGHISEDCDFIISGVADKTMRKNSASIPLDVMISRIAKYGCDQRF